MKSTQWRDDYTRIVKGRAIGYSSARGAFRQDMPFENVHGNGGLLTTVGDLLLWTENLNTGSKVGGRAFVEAMHRQMRLNKGLQIAYASGLVVGSYNGVPEVSHGGATAGYRAYLVRFPEQKLAVSLLCNVGNVNPGAVAYQVADVFLGSAAKATPPAPAVALPAAELAAKAGLYRNTRTSDPMKLEVADGKLRIAGGPELVPLGGAAFRVGAGDGRAFFEPSRGGGRAALLQIDADGDTIRHEPVEPFTPSAAQLAEFAGDYSSDEAEVTYTIAVQDGKLVARRRPDWTQALTPAYRDAFDAGGLLVRFTRDGAGRVNGLSLWLGRVRDMRLTRVAK
jgi:hypothetical protein